jgi:hypothetical protein
MGVAGCATLLLLTAPGVAARHAEGQAGYRVEARSERAGRVETLYTPSQVSLLEKLNRADRKHLERLPVLVVPEFWVEDELAYSVLPTQYAPAEASSTFLIVYIPGQVFGAYEFGRLVRWGPISSGGRRDQTPSGLFALNWRSIGRASTVDPDWFMPWYFNFGNLEGLAFHSYALPGQPASHGCIRLLERDARWLHEWGEPWVLDPGRTRVLSRGTPVFIVGRYDFAAAPPWRSVAWLSTTVGLPPAPVEMTDASLPGDEHRTANPSRAADR